MSEQQSWYPVLDSGNSAEPPLPRRSRLAVTALVFGVLSIPLALTIYLGAIAGLAAVGCGIGGWVGTRGGRRPGRGMALAGLIGGVVGLVIAGSLFTWGLRTVHACQDRMGHRPSSSELKTCIRDGI